MSESLREPVLPDGFTELGQVLELQKQTDKALKKVAIDIEKQGEKLAPLIFARLRRTVDEDLLFSDQPELIMPSITVMADSVLRELSPNVPDSRLDSWMVGIISQQVHKYIQRHRPERR